jgi:DNA-binding response OmpR family regulator
MAQPAGARILLVDDEPTIRLTLPQILQMHGFQVTSVSTVPEALDAIARQPLEVLLADLNIGQPGDGFTVVSAMRRTQPTAVTIIITGFPAFETALEAIRNQVDDYIVKPADIPSLIRVIEEHLNGPRPAPAVATKRVRDILGEHQDTIAQQWLEAVTSDPELNRIFRPEQDAREQIAAFLRVLIETLRSPNESLSPQTLAACREHGAKRHQQGYSITQLMKEARHLRRAINLTVQQHLLALDISHLLSDLILAGDNFDLALRVAVESFLAEERRTAA